MSEEMSKVRVNQKKWSFSSLIRFFSSQHEKHFTANSENWHLFTYFIISYDLLSIIIIVHYP